MKRKDLIDYLSEEACMPSEFDEDKSSEGGEIFVNVVNGRDVIIPNDEVISDLVVVLILRVLNVDPPIDLDDFYNATAPEIDKLIEEQMQEIT